jgi:hypothetical protein
MWFANECEGATRGGADKKTRGRSNGERFTGGWKGSTCGGAGIEITVRSVIAGGSGETSAGGLMAPSTEGLAVACAGSSTNGRWNCADCCSRSDSLCLR